MRKKESNEQNKRLFLFSSGSVQRNKNYKLLKNIQGTVKFSNKKIQGFLIITFGKASLVLGLSILVHPGDPVWSHIIQLFIYTVEPMPFI